MKLFTIALEAAVGTLRSFTKTHSASASSTNLFDTASSLVMIPADNPYDATDLIADLIAKGGKVTYHPINGVWLDIGSPDDFRHAQELIQNKQLSKL